MPRRLILSLFALLLFIEPTVAADWWAIQPLSKPKVPTGPAHPIDAFIQQQLTRQQLQPAPAVDRATFIRRVTYNLTGLPPTPAEITAYITDTAANADTKLIDRLLASPRHGERMARRWMDAVHFAETHGHDQDRIREHAWPYRDYLINAFNNDVPYAKFVKEQIAGDSLYPDEPQATIALGLLAAGPWDESTLRDIREDTLDRQMGRYLDRDDIITTVMQTFTSTTVHCARCHDHKFDPISQADYYALQAVFAGADRGVRTADVSPEIAKQRQRLQQQRQQLATLQNEAIATLRPKAAKILAARKQTPTTWNSLTPSEYRSANGAELLLLPDGSVLSKGKRPETDILTLTFPLKSDTLTAIRLDVLADDSLPLRGPGRQDNGNLHLSEIEFHLTRPDGKPTERLTIGRPSADHDQDGWTIQHAVDGNPRTAWGIYPAVGKSHAAMFPLLTPANNIAGSQLTVTLKQLHGGGHLIGRARISESSTANVPALIPGELDYPFAIPLEQWPELTIRDFIKQHEQQRIDTELARLPKPQMIYAAGATIMPDGGHRGSNKPRVVNVLKRGEITKPGPVAEPGSFQVKPLSARFKVTNLDDEASRRAALAGWLTHKDNAIVWRSIVNRVWAWHFGTGLVSTINDFGAMGSTPSHPELLDWLACEFRDGRQSLKDLHRLIVTSATYRQATTATAKAHETDPENRWLGRMNRQRLDAEQIRDAVLLANGRLDLRMGGPSDRQFAMRPGVHVTPVVDYSVFDLDSDASRRRSVYRFLFRTLPDPLLDSLDCPAGDQLAPQRLNSVTVQQALAMWNSKFMLKQADHLAVHLDKQEKTPASKLRLVAAWLWGRTPTTAEEGRLLEYAATHGWPSLCRVLMNSNEFVFIN